MAVLKIVVLLLIVLNFSKITTSPTNDPCSQSSFCGRIRNHFKKEKTNYKVLATSIELSPLGSNKLNQFSATIVSQSTPDLCFKMVLLEDFVVRLKINECYPSKKRFNLDFNFEKQNWDYKELQFESLQIYQERKQKTKDSFYDPKMFKEGIWIVITPKYENPNDLQIFLRCEPTFQLLIVENSQTLISINKNNFLHFEQGSPITKNYNNNNNNNNNNDNDNDNDNNNNYNENTNESQQFTNCYTIGIDVQFENSNNVYGLPEHPTKLKLIDTVNNSPYQLFNFDGFPNKENSHKGSYGSIPLVLSKNEDRTGLIGSLWNNPSETFIDIETIQTPPINSGLQTKTKLQDGLFTEKSVTSKKVHWFSETGIIDLFLFISHPKKKYHFFNLYSTITGYPHLPQYFSLGFHQSRWQFESQYEIIQLNNLFNQHKIPLDSIWLDIYHTNEKKYFTWDKYSFPNPIKMLQYFKNNGRKIVTIVDPHLKIDQNWPVYQQAKEFDLLIKNNKFEDYEEICWPGMSVWPDFLNPATQKWWGNLFSMSQYESFDNLFIWNDMNEPAVFGNNGIFPKDNLHYGGIEHGNIHNMYGHLMVKSTYQGLVDRNMDQGKLERPFILTRSFWVGTQKYAASWTGDNTASWEHLQLAESMALSLGLSGMVFVGEDVGGFFNNADAELFTRWFQTSSFHPFFRSHSNINSLRIYPWSFGEPYTSIIRNSIITRYTLLPLYYTLFYKAHTTGKPIMRPLWLHFPKDLNLYRDQIENNQYLIGSELLIAPVNEKGKTTQRVYLPKGYWYEFDSMKQIKSQGQFYQIQNSIDKIPIYYVGGKIIPRKLTFKPNSGFMKRDPFTLFVTLNKHKTAKGKIYYDNGHSLNTQKSKKFILQGLFFENNKLFTKTYNSGYYKTKVSQIIIMGVKNVSTVYLNNPNLNLNFEYNQSKAILTINNPEIYIGDNWEINIF
ncbi:hypothetical protein M0813_23988 [Anaeramoeba flamelloides]|uniref:Alpha-glucosidase n=1 Tax=Anaeramoeba flamelloides TaxID=1746091 RepID=A0ABQ8Y9C7_9EUKA|nr:hypothetical protein M0813_23988 [Anaeramoeba flamelloides]